MVWGSRSVDYRGKILTLDRGTVNLTGSEGIRAMAYKQGEVRFNISCGLVADGYAVSDGWQSRWPDPISGNHEEQFIVHRTSDDAALGRFGETEIRQFEIK